VARASRRPGSRTEILAFTAAFLAFSCLAAPAAAQVGATLSAFSDSRFRGYSQSEGRPVAVLDFAYDDPSGFYLDASGTGVLRLDGHAAPLGLQVNAGYAKRLRSGTTLDFGITQSAYSHYSRSEASRSYTEVYAGISRGGLSSRIFFSPHYSEAGLWTAYGELNGTVSPARKWSLDGHVGMLVPLRTPAGPERYRAAFDWRLGVTRELGPLSLHLAWEEGTRGRAYYGDRALSGHALVVGASWIL
jgi:uncharacterized protein (TIGR02001 family)